MNKALEVARSEKTVGKSLDAEVTLYLNGAMEASELEAFDLQTMFIVSKVTVCQAGGPADAAGALSGVTVAVEPSQAPKCARCWAHHEAVGSDEAHPDLCPRCAGVVG